MSDLSEIAKLAWRALVEAEQVIDTIETEDDEEAGELFSLQTRISSITQSLFMVLNLTQADADSMP